MATCSGWSLTRARSDKNQTAWRGWRFWKIALRQGSRSWPPLRLATARPHFHAREAIAVKRVHRREHQFRARLQRLLVSRIYVRHVVIQDRRTRRLLHVQIRRHRRAILGNGIHFHTPEDYNAKAQKPQPPARRWAWIAGPMPGRNAPGPVRNSSGSWP